MRKLLPFFLISLAFSFTVKIITNTDGISAFCDYCNSNIALRSGENVVENLKPPTTFRFSSFYGKGWVAPREITVNATATIYVVASMRATRVIFDTEPEGADVYIIFGDGKVKVGETPFDGEVPIGRWKFRFEKDGYYPLEKFIDVKGGEKYSFNLKPKNLYTFITTPPASILIDGKVLGDTPVSTILRNGTHTVEFTVEGLLAKRVKVFVGKDSKPTTVNLRLPRVIKVKIDTDPKPVFVSFDKEIFRSPVVLKTLEGEHEISCWANGYEKIVKRKIFKSSTSVKCNLVRNAHKIVFTREGTLTIDGSVAGYGRKFTVRSGLHLIEFTWDEDKVALWFSDIRSDRYISAGDDIGTVIVLLKSYMIDGKEYVGPGVVQIKAGRHMLYSSGMYIPFSIRGGEIKVLPSGKALFVLSDPLGMKVVVKDEESLKEIVTPEIMRFSGKASVMPVSGCKIKKIYSVSTEKDYGVVFIDSSCAGGKGE